MQLFVYILQKNEISQREGYGKIAVGKVGGKQNLNLENGCLHNRIIEHEMLHSLGVHHEQNRADRLSTTCHSVNNEFTHLPLSFQRQVRDN